jgi:sulfur carrier protein
MNTTALTLKINGEAREIGAATLNEALVEIGVDPTRAGIAVALNGAVVPRSRWADTVLAAGDDLEVIGATQGG